MSSSRNGEGHGLTILTTWAIVASAVSVNLTENQFRSGLVRVERAVRERLATGRIRQSDAA